VTKFGLRHPKKKERKKPPKNGEFALWSYTRVVKYENDFSQKQNGFNNKSQWYNIWKNFQNKPRTVRFFQNALSVALISELVNELITE